MKKFTIGQNDAGQRLDKFLSKLLKDAPMGMIYKWLRKKRVKVNGKKQEISYVLEVGDVRELYIRTFLLPTSRRGFRHTARMAVCSNAFSRICLKKANMIQRPKTFLHLHFAIV